MTLCVHLINSFRPPIRAALESLARYEEDLGVTWEPIDPKEAERRKNDPINSVNVPSFVKCTLSQLSATNGQALQAAAGELTDLQRQTLQQILM